MYNSPYETSVGRQHDVGEIVTAVEIMKNNGSLVSGIVDGNRDIYAIITQTANVGDDGIDYAAGIQLLPHPITVKGKLDKRIFTVVDLRSYSRALTATTDNRIVFPITGAIPFNLMRARLQQKWILRGPTGLDEIKRYPMNIFSGWVTGLIDRKLTISDDEAYRRCRVITALWFESQFIPTTPNRKQLTGQEIADTALYIKDVTGVDYEIALNTVEAVGSYIPTIDDFLNALHTFGGSIRYKQLSKPIFLTLMVTSWFGTALVREVVGVGLEYPPTFIAMVWAALTERTYRETPIGRLVNNQADKDKGKQFLREIDDYLSRG